MRRVDGRLLSAIEAGSLDRVRRALDRGAAPDCRRTFPGLRDKHGTLDEAPAVIIAAARGDGPIVAALLEAGADIDDCGTDYVTFPFTDEEAPIASQTALTIALERRHREAAQLLIERGANVNLQQPLCVAAQSGALDVVQMLIERGACVQEADSNAHSALHYAAVEGHFEVLKTLYRRGGRFSRCLDLQSAEEQAREHGHAGITKWLTERGARKLLRTQYSFWRAVLQPDELEDAFVELVSAIDRRRLNWGPALSESETTQRYDIWEDHLQTSRWPLGTRRVTHIRTTRRLPLREQPQPVCKVREELTTTGRPAFTMTLDVDSDRAAKPLVLVGCRGSGKALDTFDDALDGLWLSFDLHWLGDAESEAQMRHCQAPT